MKLIPLSRGLFAQVDDPDFNALSAFRWKAVKGKNTWYAARAVGDSIVYMHRQLTAAPTDLQVDHEDRNGLNNQRANLRVTTPAVNNQNRRTWGRSRFKGVGPHQGKWRARIKIAGKLKELGYFANEVAAAAAYNVVALAHYGESASINDLSPLAALDAEGGKR